MTAKIVYVVVSRLRSRINEREQKLLQLGDDSRRVVLICRGDNRFAEDVWEIAPRPNPTGILRKLGASSLKRVVDRWLFFPSTHLLYVDAVYRRLRRRIRQDLERGEAVSLITCLPAHDLSLLGLRVKSEFPQVRWICDWQDLWSYDEYYLERVPALYRNRLRRLERLVLDGCDMNVTTNSHAERLLVEEFGVPPERCRGICHPFDEELAAETVSGLPERVTEPKGVVRMVFLGTLFKPPKMPGDRLLRAMKYVREKGIDVRMDVYGSLFPDRLPLEECGVTHRGHLSRGDIVGRLREYDLLVLIMADLPNCKVVMNIKLPSYFVAGRPICAIVPEDSAVAEMVNRTGTGYVVPAAGDWNEGLYRMLCNYLSGSSPPVRNEKEIARFGWRHLSREWREIL